MFLQEFAARLCGRTNMIPLMAKENSKESFSQTNSNVSHSFSAIHATEKRLQRFKGSLGGILPIRSFLSMLLHASIKILMFNVRQGGEEGFEVSAQGMAQR